MNVERWGFAVYSGQHPGTGTPVNTGGVGLTCSSGSNIVAGFRKRYAKMAILEKNMKRHCRIQGPAPMHSIISRKIRLPKWLY